MTANAERAHDSGIRYCIIHDGIIEQDQTDCDFSRHDPVDDEAVGECVSRALVYFLEEA